MTLFCSILIVWSLLAFAVALYWYAKGLSFGHGFRLSFLLTPPVGLAVGLMLPPDRRLWAQRHAPGGRLRRCAHCRSLIALRSRVCPLCYRAIPDPVLATAESTGYDLVAPVSAVTGRQFAIAEEGFGRQRALVLRELPPGEFPDDLGWRRGGSDGAEIAAPAAPVAFPLDLALYAAHQKRLQSAGGPRSRRPIPIRVHFLDGVVEELL